MAERDIVKVVRVRRIYDPPESTDGYRVLVDRLWPRGMSKERAALDAWCRAVSPSTELRRWYGHDPTLFAEFRTKYLAELEDPDRAAALASLRTHRDHGITLLTATRDPDISEAAVLADRLRAMA